MSEFPPTYEPENAWQRFWNRGGWWRALLFVVVYLALYEGLSFLISTVFASQIDASDLFGSESTVFFGVALPILVMGLLVLVFVVTQRWKREIFGRQPVTGAWWMWIAVVLLIIPIVLRLFATDWGAYTPTVVLTVLFMGLCVSFAEELLTRGVAVNMLRRHGYGERAVFVLSSAIFALLHSVNALSGAEPLVVAITVVYTFGFGAMMYLTMRVTGSIIPAILLHAATDPTTFLATGGIDAHGSTAGDSGLLTVAGLFNGVYLVFGLIAIIFVSGRVFARRGAKGAAAS
ncbi:CPBP family glutamic-type intramembrane protease [Microbacterium sp. W1N]|uniref:CPBP family intramembrane glutamic endopeptidase n=1 Tax=Microbacterium festucae TaxID=2977531 RepID=UPI0021C06465|nr:CPBP family glutamic-type intramembrane protease [Microbacterium festucae]MCT9819838.1 CPBP family glutamic-type intramembrane protease [Microbacterium festucae]